LERINLASENRESSLMKKLSIEPGESTREKLMQSAERLFAARGFDGVSVRDIANDAKVNSALVGYYFGGKKELLAEVYTRHCAPLKNERVRLLGQYSADHRVPSLEEVLEAFVRPSLQATQEGRGGPRFSRLRAILSAENSSLLEELVAENFDESSRIFVKALCKCLPDLSREDVLWRFHFLLGSIYYTALGPHRIKILSKGRCDPSDPAETTRELIPFIAAGFRASPAVATTSGPAATKRLTGKSRRQPAQNQ
jgi:AcrR family transcriptional regulator